VYPVSAPRPLARRPLYTVAPDPAGGWRVTARRGRRGRGGLPDRASAVAHAERLAATHPVAQIRVFGEDGSLVRDEAARHEGRCREVAEWLEAYLAPWRDYAHARNQLVDEGFVEDRPVRVAGAALRLFLAAREGQAWDEIHVHAHLADEESGPPVAQEAFVVFGW